MKTKINKKIDGELKTIEMPTWLFKKNMLWLEIESWELIDYTEKSYALIDENGNKVNIFLPKSQIEILEELEELEEPEIVDFRSILIDFLKENGVKNIKKTNKNLTLFKKLNENKLAEKFKEETGIIAEEIFYYDEFNYGKKVNYIKFTKTEIKETIKINEDGENRIIEIKEIIEEKIDNSKESEMQNFYKKNFNNLEDKINSFIKTFLNEDKIKVFFEGCHKIYVTDNETDAQTQKNIGYDEYELKDLINLYNNSCELKFINYKKNGEYYNIVQQGEEF